MGAGLTVRVAAQRDADAAVDVIRASITELCTADHQGDAATLEQWLANKTAARFQAWIARPGQYTVVVERDGILCGVGMLGGEGVIHLCYVHPDHTRHGVGRALVEAMETEARARGLVRLRLDATDTAMRFYEAMGFRRCGPSRAGFGVTRANPCEKWLARE